jgi:hypothetical protein
MISWAAKNLLGDMISLKHTSRIEERMEEAADVLSAAKGDFNSYTQLIEKLSKIQINTEKLDAFTKAVFPVPADLEKFKRTETRRVKQREKLVELFESGIGQDIPGVAGTGWAAYNAVTEYINHHRPIRGKANAEEKRFIGAAFKESPLVQKATRFLLAA